MQTFNKVHGGQRVNILAADHSTVVLSGIKAGKEELSGRQLEEAQDLAAQVNIRFTVRYTTAIQHSHYVQDAAGDLYPIIYLRDPGVPDPAWERGQVRPGKVLELYTYRINAGTLNT